MSAETTESAVVEAAQETVEPEMPAEGSADNNGSQGQKTPEPQGLESLVVELMERVEKQDQQLAELHDFYHAIASDDGKSVSEERLIGIFRLRLEAAGQKLGAELSGKVDQALNGAKSAVATASEAKNLAEAANKTAEATKNEGSILLDTSREVLEQASIVREGIEEMERIGAFCSETQSEIERIFEATKAELAKIAAIAQPAPAPVLAETPAPETPKPALKPWQR